ncbi:MAG: hypothetical protein J3R72DRAFT_440110 [Linnemannia gamsii]|nr:MAG: hypothetical protein J3R72DRAFT_440110 [Linnemannia gamsii]
MGHDSIGDFAYIGTFPDQNAGATNNNSNNFSDYEMNPRGYNSFQQTYEVQHLNRAFTPESNTSLHQQQQQQQYQHQSQPRQLVSYSQPPIVHRAYSEQFVVQQQQHTYPDPALVDTQENEAHRTAIATRSRSYSSSSPSSSPPPLIKPPMGSRRKRIFWIGAGMVITLLGAIIILVVVLKMDRSNENSGHPGSDGNYDNNFPSTQPPVYTAGTPTSSIPFARPTSANTNNNPVSAPPLPTPLPPPSQCPEFYCTNYFLDCQYQTCKWDGDYQACRANCSRDGDRCDAECKRFNSCYRQCKQNFGVCLDYCNVVIVVRE